MGADFEPSDADILRARVRTTGVSDLLVVDLVVCVDGHSLQISETRFQIGKLSYLIFVSVQVLRIPTRRALTTRQDVGGQRSERKKW